MAACDSNDILKNLNEFIIIFDSKVELQKYENILVLASKIHTHLERINITESDSKRKILQEILSLCKTRNFITLIVKSFKKSDKYLQYQLIKIVSYLFYLLPNLVSKEEELLQIMHHKELMKKILKVINNKIKMGESNSDLLQYSMFLNCSIKESNFQLNHFISTYSTNILHHDEKPNDRILKVLNTLEIVTLQLKILLKFYTKEYIIEDGIVHLVNSLKCFIKYWLNMKNISEIGLHIPYHMLWFYIVKVLKAMLNIAKNDQISIASKCLNCIDEIIHAILHEDLLKNLTVLEGRLIGIEENALALTSPLQLVESSMRTMIIICVDLLNIRFCKTRIEDDLNVNILQVFGVLNKFPNIKKNEDNLLRSLLDVFMEQDNEMIQIAHTLLRIYMASSRSSFASSSSDTIKNREQYNPFILFHEMITMLSYDESILLDWLVSTESNFISYFYHYLDTVHEKFDHFIQTLERLDTQSSSQKVVKKLERLDLKLDTTTETFSTKVCSLVQYSSSSDDDDVAKSYSHSVDLHMSCLIRLNIKLDRMNVQSLLQHDVSKIVQKIEKIELIYEQ